MKAEILKILRNKEGFVSGQSLSTTLGISRVSIWKHIQKLQEAGYRIDATAKGYRLLNSPDVPYPWEFPGRESSLFYFPEVTSTMDIAKDMARKGCPDFTVVVAERQEKGRGRLNRVWRSAQGGLYFTMVLRPRLPLVLSSRVGFCASMTLARLLRKAYDIEAVVKWPNDILVHERKLVGMLIEMEAEADRIHFMNIGLGVNANNDLSPSEPQAVSLKKILGKEISRKELLSGFLDEFEDEIKKTAFENAISDWKRFTLTLNRYVRVVTGRDAIEGLAVDVDENGALILKTGDGSLKKILYGDCFHGKQP
jgi:BirA family biotin operon repressor/biotin-[acetyl-CoA-carboxylase] ligase